MKIKIEMILKYLFNCCHSTACFVCVCVLWFFFFPFLVLFLCFLLSFIQSILFVPARTLVACYKVLV